LYDSSCNTIVENDDGTSDDRNFRIVTATMSAGTYYVSVRHYSFSGSGSYTLVVSLGTVSAVRLSVTKAGTGAGSIVSTPAGINCDRTCTTASADYSRGAQVTLTARAEAGSTFTGWSGACSGTTCAVTMNADTRVTATFDLAVTGPSTHILEVFKTGPISNTGGALTTGTGSITSNPVGIVCGTNCGTHFATRTTVTLTATADTGSTFAGWTGPCAPTDAKGDITPLPPSPGGAPGAGGAGGTAGGPPVSPTCTVTLDSDITATASFTAPARGEGGPTFGGNVGGVNLYVYTMFSTTEVGGTVTSIPAGINCTNRDTLTSPCVVNRPSNSFALGLPVILTATASRDWVFTGWSGEPPIGGGESPAANCTDANSPCTVVAGSGGKVYATFRKVAGPPPTPSRFCFVTCQATGCFQPVNFQSRVCADCALQYNLCVAARAAFGCANASIRSLWNACQ
jgi:hypothetical protein